MLFQTSREILYFQHYLGLWLYSRGALPTFMEIRLKDYLSLDRGGGGGCG